MVSKTIVVMDDNRRRKNWIVGNQAALDNLLRRYRVDVFVEESPYKCEVAQYVSLVEGGIYTLGDSFSSSVELQEYNTNDKNNNNNRTSSMQ